MESIYIYIFEKNNLVFFRYIVNLVHVVNMKTNESPKKKKKP